MHDKKYVAINWKLKIRTQEIERKETIKFLGVIIDECLQWKDHIDCASSKIIKSLVLDKGMKYIWHEREDFKTLYYTIVYPHLTYETEVWDGVGATRPAAARRN